MVKSAASIAAKSSSANTSSASCDAAPMADSGGASEPSDGLLADGSICFALRSPPPEVAEEAVAEVDDLEFGVSLRVSVGE